MGTAPQNYQTPKTTWAAGNVPAASDFNRIEGNIYAIEEGSRTIDPTQVPASNQGTLRQFLDWFANRIKAITGKTNWYDAPSKTLEDLNSHINAPAPHSGHALVSDLTAHASNITHIPYAVVTGSANAYSVSISGITTYQEGLAIAVKINVDNTGASTININGLGAKSIKKPNGNDVAAGNLKAGSVYTLRFNGTNFILQGSDSAGNATPADVLVGKTFSNDNGPNQVGTMPNKVGSGTIITPGTTDIAIPQGYYGGALADGKVKGDANLIANNIRNGITIFGVNGSLLPLEYTVGDNILWQNSLNYATTSTTPKKRIEFTMTGHGSIRIYAYLYSDPDYTNSYMAFYKNDIQQSPTFSTSSRSPTKFSYDISVVEGDKLQIYVWVANSAYSAIITLYGLSVGWTVIPTVNIY